MELCSHWGFLISVDSDIESDLDRSQAARHFLIDGTALEGIDLEMPANHAHAKPARGLQGLLDSARGRGPRRRGGGVTRDARPRSGWPRTGPDSPC